MPSSPGLPTKLGPSCELSATTVLRGFLRYLPPAIAPRPSDITGYFVDATETAVLSLVFSARNARELPLPLAEGRANSPWPSEPRRHGGVDAAAQRRPSRPLKIRGNLVSPDRSVGFWDFNRRMVRQVGGALFAGITTLPRPSAARTPMFWALPQRFAFCNASGGPKAWGHYGRRLQGRGPFLSCRRAVGRSATNYRPGSWRQVRLNLW